MNTTASDSYYKFYDYNKFFKMNPVVNKPKREAKPPVRTTPPSLSPAPTPPKPSEAISRALEYLKRQNLKS